MEPYKTTYKTYFGLLHQITTQTPNGPKVEYDLSMGARLLLTAGTIIGALAVTDASERQYQRETDSTNTSIDKCLETSKPSWDYGTFR